MPSTRSTYTWTRLTQQQIDALVDVASKVDRCPTSLSLFLPEMGKRTAFRSAVDTLTRLKVANEASS